MHVSPIEGPDGSAVFKAGGDNSWRTGTMKGWNWSLEWAKSGRKFPRVLVIWPETQGIGTKAGFWTIAHTAMVEFLDFDRDGIATGKPSDLLFVEARYGLEIMGKDPNDKQALFGLVDLVVARGPDMALQPIAPMHVKQRLMDNNPMWEMTATNKATGKTIDESAV